jgi:PAS domain S-box-containing protein
MILIAMFTAIVGGFGALSNKVIQQEFVSVVDNSVHAIETLDKLKFAGLRIVSSTTEFTLNKLNQKTGDSKQSSQELLLINGGKTDYRDALMSYREHANRHLENDDAAFALIKKYGENLLRQSDEIVDILEDGQENSIGEIKEKFEEAEMAFLKAVDSAIILERRNLSEKKIKVQNTLSLSYRNNIVLTVIAFTIAIVSALLLSRRITQPLESLKNAASSIEKGNLNIKIPSVKSDEMGEALNAFNRMAESLDSARKASAEAQQFAEDIVHSLHQPLITTDFQGMILNANPETSTLLGIQQESLITRSIEVIFLNAEIVPIMLSHIHSTGELTATETECKGCDAEIISSSVSASLMKANHGESPGIIWLLLDIRTRKKAEEEKQALERQLEQSHRLESLGVLAGGIAHDFNNILSVIIGYCSLAMMEHSGDINDYLSNIEKAAVRAAELCRQMLAFAGKAQLVRSQVNIGELVDESVNMLKSSINKNVIITSTIASDIPCIATDPSQISQVVMNLIINASEAIGNDQGEVIVSLTKTKIKSEPSEIDYLGKIITPGWYACLEVTDNGCGMSDETSNRIFEPFYSTKFTGRGLGMSAILGIITVQGGAIQLFSQVGMGTTFKIYFSLQINEDLVISTLKVTDQTELWHENCTILLVEDEKQVIDIAKNMLQKMGFRIIEATNGKEGLEKYQKYANDITLVMTDLGMPIMDGYTLFYELKRLDSSLPIIISSGFGDSDITSRIPREDIASIVSKPYNFSQLQNVIKSVVENMATVSS